ncbi:unnamed protein product [Rhizophagus irregularis]|nr:unnamed protein product [Rhizophagus irregularis]
MIERALEIKPLLAHLVSNLQTLTNNWPTEEEWEILADLLELLAPFALITKVIFCFQLSNNWGNTKNHHMEICHERKVFQPIQELMANYQELTTPVSQTTTVRCRLASYHYWKHEAIFRTYSCLIKLNN